MNIPAGGTEYSLTENVTPPFQAELTHPKANLSEPPQEDFVTQLEEAGKEWKRRMKRPKV
jgi:hypothetical protein